ncbi:MAG: hypothetical protein KatS3mg110_2213 [Pirellulaceae bacterium]|nr:MAG: hypothetical protein KatS3mg110_2213 [Pirellulaceae bacterium]
MAHDSQLLIARASWCAPGGSCHGTFFFATNIGRTSQSGNCYRRTAVCQGAAGISRGSRARHRDVARVSWRVSEVPWGGSFSLAQAAMGWGYERRREPVVGCGTGVLVRGRAGFISTSFRLRRGGWVGRESDGQAENVSCRGPA